MVHQLPELPYARNALEPYISAETLNTTMASITRPMSPTSIT